MQTLHIIHIENAPNGKIRLRSNFTKWNETVEFPMLKVHDKMYVVQDQCTAWLRAKGFNILGMAGGHETIIVSDTLKSILA